MVLRDINQITLPNHIWKHRKKIQKDYSIIGLDTETERGKAILIMDSHNNQLIPNHIDDVLKFITNKRYENTINFFHNVKYDYQAMLKFLPENHLMNIANFNETVYTDRYSNEYFISIIPDKLLKIRKGHHTVKFFDSAQFFDKQPLKNLALKVGMEKYQLDDIENLSKKRMIDDYEYRNEVIKRCYIDCVITEKIGVLLNDTLKKFVKLRNFYSGASISRQLVLQNLNQKFLKLPSLRFMDYALKSYNAGRFEILKRGYFPVMVERDINSAYPNEIANLYDCEGVYIYNKEYEPDSTHSFFNCDLEIYDCSYSPFKYQLPQSKKSFDFYNDLPTNLLIYPLGKFKNQYLSKSDYETIYNLGYPIKINHAVHLMNSNATKPFDYVEDLYYYRKKLQHGNKQEKIEKNPELANTIKTALNSIYGTFINVNHEKGLTQDETEDTKDFTVIDGEIWFSKNKIIAGNMFNPVFATEICSNVRNKLYNDFYKYEDKIICIATDGIKLTQDVNIKESGKLGEYDKSKITDGLLIGSGVYQFGDNFKFRGFQSQKKIDSEGNIIKKMDLKDMLEKYHNKTVVKSVVNRVISLKSACKNNFITLVDEDNQVHKMSLSINDINMFIKINRDLNINFDKKREWNRDFFNCRDALENHIDSEPITISYK